MKAQWHSATSVGAAMDIEGRKDTLRLEVLRFLRRQGARGATDQEMQKALSMVGSTQRPRRVELVERELVRDSGLRRFTESGRTAVVWRAETIQW